MPDIEIGEGQRTYLDDLRAELAERFVGEYGTVRPRDALQFLIDQYEGDAPPIETDAGAASGDGGDGGSDGDGGDDAQAPDDPEDRLEAMMNLLDEYDDRWEADDDEDEKYAVTLPDGEVERVRTKDDVRALLFQHYR